MKPDQISVTAVNPRTPSRRADVFAVAIASLAVCLGIAACDGRNVNFASIPQGAESRNSDTVDLRVFPPEGFKGTTHSETSARFKSGTGGMDSEERTEMEVLSVKEDQATFKYNTATDISFWGTATPNPDADRSKRRLCIQTVDRTGKVLSSEGESPDNYDGVAWPDRPLKLGETWITRARGTGLYAGDTLTASCTIKEVVSIKGRSMAVVEFTAESRTGTIRGTRWCDLKTGLVAKEKISGSVESADGWPITITGSSWFVDADGNRWVE